MSNHPRLHQRTSKQPIKRPCAYRALVRLECELQALIYFRPNGVDSMKLADKAHREIYRCRDAIRRLYD